jgi:lipoprotein-anchoring transpeptidase ErfK/SrfK
MKRAIALAFTCLTLTLASAIPARADETVVQPIPRACKIATTICIDTTFLTLRYVSDGKILRTMDIRVGAPKFPTDQGLFHVYRKARHHSSSDYGTPMPYSLFYNGAESIHYSYYFHRDGYNGASHGCVNLRDFAGAGWLFRHSPLGTRVYVY